MTRSFLKYHWIYRVAHVKVMCLISPCGRFLIVSHSIGVHEFILEVIGNRRTCIGICELWPCRKFTSERLGVARLVMNFKLDRGEHAGFFSRDSSPCRMLLLLGRWGFIRPIDEGWEVYLTILLTWYWYFDLVFGQHGGVVIVVEEVGRAVSSFRVLITAVVGPILPPRKQVFVKIKF